MDDYGANVVGMRLKRSNLLRGIVVVDTNGEVIRTANDPVLPRDEAAGANGDICQLKGLDDCLGFVGPDVGVARVESGQDLESTQQYSLLATSRCQYPWFCWVKVDALDPL
jgi:hypothetical protein